jgi:hypothetical protein
VSPSTGRLVSTFLNAWSRSVMLESIPLSTFLPRFVDAEKGDVHERPKAINNPKKAASAKSFFLMSAAVKMKKNGELPFK